MDQNSIERHFAHVLQTREHHADYPEEDDVITGDQCIGGIEVFQFLGVVRPAQCGERPQCGTEPSVQGIRILPHGLAALRADCAAFLGDCHFAAVVAVERRNLVTPPQLTGNAPVLDVFQPVEINFVEPFRNELGLAALYGINCRLCQRFHLDKPLLGNSRLDGRTAAVAGANIVTVILDFYQCALSLQIFHDCLSCLVAIHARILRVCIHDLCIVRHDIDDFQIMAQTDFKVVRVVCRCDLYHAGSEVHFNIVVCHNGNLTVYQRQDQSLAH